MCGQNGKEVNVSLRDLTLLYDWSLSPCKDIIKHYVKKKKSEIVRIVSGRTETWQPPVIVRVNSGC